MNYHIITLCQNHESQEVYICSEHLAQVKPNPGTSLEVAESETDLCEFCLKEISESCGICGCTMKSKDSYGYRGRNICEICISKN